MHLYLGLVSIGPAVSSVSEKDVVLKKTKDLEFRQAIKPLLEYFILIS